MNGRCSVQGLCLRSVQTTQTLTIGDLMLDGTGHFICFCIGVITTIGCVPGHNLKKKENTLAYVDCCQVNLVFRCPRLCDIQFTLTR